jgi:hypothetical protein
MGTLKTTINLTSKDSLPTGLNETSTNTITTANLVDSGRKTVGVFTTNYFNSGDGLLSNKESGTNGTYLYVKSLSTNTNKVKLYGYDQTTKDVDLNNDNVEAFATLKPGDSMLVALTPQQSNVFAVSTFGEAVIDYYLIDRDGEFGESLLLLDNNNTNYKYVVLDAQLAEVLPSGNPSPYWGGKDLGLATADWILDDTLIIADKGYIIKFYDNSNGDHRIFKFINSKGEVEGTWEYTGGYDDWMTYYGYMESTYSAVYWDGSKVYMTIFDGNNVYQHEFSSGDGYDFLWDWDQCSNDGSFVFQIYDYLGNAGDTAHILINKDKSYVLQVLNYNDTQEYVDDASVQLYANFVFLTIYSDDTSTYEKFKIFNTNGTLLHEYNLNDHYYMDNLDYYFYGSNKIVFIFYDNNTDNDYIFTYDGTTNTLNGINLETNLLNIPHNWNDFSYRNIYAFSKYLDGGYQGNSFDKESLVIIYSDNQDNRSTRHINSEVNYCDILYMLSSQNTITTFTFANNETKYIRIPYTWWDYTITPSSNLITISYGASYYKTGPLNVFTITPSGIGSFTLASEMDKAIGGISSWSSSVRVEPFGEYVMYSTRIENPSASTTTFTAVKSSTVKDSFTSNGDARGNYYIQYNSLAFYGDQTYKLWYFNTLNNKFTEIPNGWDLYNDIYTPNYENNVNGLNNGNMLLYPTSLDVTNPVFRIIKKGVLSNTVTLPSTDGAWDMSIGYDFVALWYQDMDDKYVWKVNIYDLNLNLNRTISLLSTSYETNYILGRRAYFQTYQADPKGEVDLYSYYMISTNGVAYWTNTYNNLNHTYNNFGYYWD